MRIIVGGVLVVLLSATAAINPVQAAVGGHNPTEEVKKLLPMDMMQMMQQMMQQLMQALGGGGGGGGGGGEQPPGESPTELGGGLEELRNQINDPEVLRQFDELAAEIEQLQNELEAQQAAAGNTNNSNDSTGNNSNNTNAGGNTSGSEDEEETADSGNNDAVDDEEDEIAATEGEEDEESLPQAGPEGDDSEDAGTASSGTDSVARINGVLGDKRMDQVIAATAGDAALVKDDDAGVPDEKKWDVAQDRIAGNQKLIGKLDNLRSGAKQEFSDNAAELADISKSLASGDLSAEQKGHLEARKIALDARQAEILAAVSALDEKKNALAGNTNKLKGELDVFVQTALEKRQAQEAAAAAAQASQIYTAISKSPAAFRENGRIGGDSGFGANMGHLSDENRNNAAAAGAQVRGRGH